MPDYKPVDPDFESRIRASFGAQKVMHTIGARLERVTPGEVRIELLFDTALTRRFNSTGENPLLL